MHMQRWKWPLPRPDDAIQNWITLWQWQHPPPAQASNHHNATEQSRVLQLSFLWQAHRPAILFEHDREIDESKIDVAKLKPGPAKFVKIN